MTRATLRAKIKRDYPEIDGYWTDTEINDEINLAQIDVAADTLCISFNSLV